MLTEILKQQPNDAFARYGLAMAYSEADRAEEALTEFAHLHANNPDYVPGYQMAGQLLVKLGRPGEAQTVLATGVEAANRTGNTHALSEMQALLEDIGE